MKCIKIVTILLIGMLIGYFLTRCWVPFEYELISKHHANSMEDIKFLSAYLKYNNCDCIKEKYVFNSDNFDNIIKEIKQEPSILFKEKLIFPELTYLYTVDIYNLITLFNNMKCIQEIDLGSPKEGEEKLVSAR